MKLISLAVFSCFCATALAQQNFDFALLHADNTPPELMRSGLRSVDPPTQPVRTAAQFEEMEGVLIAWNNYDTQLYPLLTQITQYAQQVARVYLVCDDSNSVKTYLVSHSVTPTNVAFVQIPSNTIWARDFGPNNIYENEVNNHALVDWKYNRHNRDKDDTVNLGLSTYMNLPVYSTIQSPNLLVHTGGNFMSDGHGTAFSSKLVLNENASAGGWNNNLNEAGVDSIMRHYMGITRYIKMNTLPYDGIHHIDMHMKMLDEETLLVGSYPTGVSDGPQIDSNLHYVTTNFMDCYNRAYKVIRIPQPPDQYANYHYPDNNGSYLTYTNALILNNLILVPSYYTQYDTTALRIWQQAMPGYHVHMLDCNAIIGYSGAIHCITHELAVSDPIFMSHAHLLDTYQTTGTYSVDAYVNTASGVNSMTMHWTLDTLAGYSPVTMVSMGAGNYEAMIPAQPVGTKIFYYLEASSNSGRTARKPLVAPAGVYTFRVLGNATGIAKANDDLKLFEPYPVPANDVLNVSFYMKNNANMQLTLMDMVGRKLQTLSLTNVEHGMHHYTFDVSGLASGNYFIRLMDDHGNMSVKQVSVAK